MQFKRLDTSKWPHHHNDVRKSQFYTLKNPSPGIEQSWDDASLPLRAASCFPSTSAERQLQFKKMPSPYQQRIRKHNRAVEGS